MKDQRTRSTTKDEIQGYFRERRKELVSIINEADNYESQPKEFKNEHFSLIKAVKKESAQSELNFIYSLQGSFLRYVDLSDKEIENILKP